VFLLRIITIDIEKSRSSSTGSFGCAYMYRKIVQVEHVYEGHVNLIG
jgi:hypothetical protein